MQFLLENRLNGCQIFGEGSVFKNRTESEQNFGFPHILTLNRSATLRARASAAYPV